MAKLSIAAIATAAAVIMPVCSAFAPASSYLAAQTGKTLLTTNKMIPAELVSDMNVPTTLLSSAADSITTAATAATATSSNLLSFSDQGQNLAGIFFQASLLPYLAFLYFLSFRGNRTPNLGNFGWQYLLLFVLGTIPSGIITKSVYGQSLANTDWLHGGAEALLTITNVLIVSNAVTYVLFYVSYILMTILNIMCVPFLSGTGIS
jgi:hypothetical protein